MMAAMDDRMNRNTAAVKSDLPARGQPPADPAPGEGKRSAAVTHS